MIRNIPTHNDFYKTGGELLDLSWGMVAKLLVNLDEAEYYGIDFCKQTTCNFKVIK